MLKQLEIYNETAKFDLTFFLRNTEHGMMSLVEYNTMLFKPATIALMLEHFEALLRSIVAEPDIRLDQLEMHTESERRRARKEGTAKPNFKQFGNVKPKAID